MSFYFAPPVSPESTELVIFRFDIAEVLCKKVEGTWELVEPEEFGGKFGAIVKASQKDSADVLYKRLRDCYVYGRYRPK